MTVVRRKVLMVFAVVMFVKLSRSSFGDELESLANNFEARRNIIPVLAFSLDHIRSTLPWTERG